MYSYSAQKVEVKDYSRSLQLYEFYSCNKVSTKTLSFTLASYTGSHRAALVCLRREYADPLGSASEAEGRTHPGGFGSFFICARSSHQRARRAAALAP